MHEIDTYEVLKFNLSKVLDAEDIHLSNVDVNTHQNHMLGSMVYELQASILALPEKRVKVDEIIYDKWWDHLLSTSRLLRYVFGQPSFREVKIDEQIYKEIKIDLPIEKGRSHVDYLREPEEGWFPNY